MRINLISGNNLDKKWFLLPDAEPAYIQYLMSFFLLTLVKNCTSDSNNFLCPI